MIEFPKNWDKPTWRQWAKSQRREIGERDITFSLLSQLCALKEWHTAKHILLYMALPDEIDVTSTASDRAKSFYVPRCAPKHRLSVYKFVPGETKLCAGKYGLQEPDPLTSLEAAPGILDLVVVPALLFDEKGQRLGYGGGYYDRFLPRLRPDCVTVGVVLDSLLVPNLPSEPHDIPMNIVVTPSRTIRRADTTVPIPHPYSD